MNEWLQRTLTERRRDLVDLMEAAVAGHKTLLEAADMKIENIRRYEDEILAIDEMLKVKEEA